MGNIITTFTDNQSSRNTYWDLENCILRSEEEVSDIVQKSEKCMAHRQQGERNKMIRNALSTRGNKINSLKETNSNSSHTYRLELGLLAIKAYFMVLLDITSMNDSTLANVQWEDDDFIEEKSNSVKLRNIKRRAGNKKVVFTIQSIFMGSFRTFLKLRRFVLNGYDTETLFFLGVGKNARLTVASSRGSYGVNAYQSFRLIYPNLKFFGSQTQRKNAKKWSMKRTKGQIFLVAAWLQHTPRVSEQNYPSESRVESQNQMGDYLIYQHNITMEINNERLSSVGGCSSPDSTPQSNALFTSVKPDCRQKMTCVFCTHYRIKPIAEEIRKLLSMEYVINRHSRLYARSDIQFNTVMGPILERIRLILIAMKTRYPETDSIILEVRRDVYDNQNLYWYWEKRLEQLWELGWV
jgi:hypothetical protein